MADMPPSYQLNTGMVKNGCSPAGTSPRRSVATGCSSRAARSGRRRRISFQMVLDETSAESPPERATCRHSSPTMSQESVWKVWRSAVW